LSIHGFPASAGTFISVAAPARSRLFLINRDIAFGSSETLTQVATISGPAEGAKELADELNRAAWTGDRLRLTEIFTDLPDPVVQACERALDGCPDPASLALGSDGKPMAVLRVAFFANDPTDLAREANAAMDLGLQFLVENSLDEDGRIEFTAKLLSAECQVEAGKVSDWWLPPQSQLLERTFPHPDDLTKAFSDSRWATNVARAHWLWVEDEGEIRDDTTSATATWVVEFFDELLSPETNFRIFRQEDGLDEESRGYLTPRNRFLLWLSLWNIASDLDGMLSMDIESIVQDDMPTSVREQPLTWWSEMRASADRLCEAARLGEVSALEPRTVAEEALISLAARPSYIDWANDSLEMSNYQQIFDSLPRSPHDEDWEEVLPDLTGDADVEMVWDHHLDGIGDPDDLANKRLGIGDYRPAAWHTKFARAQANGQSDDRG
jgi:hypothetical protein